MGNLEPIQAKKVRNEIMTGTHLVIIHNMEFLKDATGNIQKIDGFPAIVVTFVTNEQKYADKMYIMDSGVKQKYFDAMINDTGVKVPEGEKIKKSVVLKKRLWVCVQEVHHVNNDKIVYDSDNKPVIEYRIFKTLPFIEGKEKSLMKGDPDINGISSDQFVSYKNVATNIIENFVVSDLTEEQFEESKFQAYKGKKAIKLDDVKLEEVSEPVFEEHTFEDISSNEIEVSKDDFDYTKIPDFKHD